MYDFALSLLLLGALSTGSQLPFWAGANQFGLMPEGSGGLALLRAGTEYDATKEFQWKWGVSLAGQYDSRCPVAPGMTVEKTADFSAMVDELYASVRWKALRLDAGMKHVDIDFLGAGMPTLGSMSTTGGHIVWSGNARTMPGYLITLDPVAVPFTHQVLWFHGAFGDYKTLDNRYMRGALIHRTKLFLLFKVHPRLDFQLGLDHVAMWGGVGPDALKPVMPVTLDNYFRVITGRHASSSGTLSDQLNVIGDHRGGLVCRLDWRGEGWKTAFQRDVPYDDGSGMAGIQNFPDGVYTLWFGFDDKDRWISDILYEYQYTMKQSGTYHDRPTTDKEKESLDPSDPYHYEHHIYGGLDNYFNNGSYASGWTYYGRTIGDPLISPKGTHDGTWTGKVPASAPVLGVENNRIKAHHLSIAGRAFHRLPYKLMLTYSQNYGTYTKPYLGESQIFKPWGTVHETPLHQFSAALLGELPFATLSPSSSQSPLRQLTLTYGLFADRGQLLPDAFGVSVGVRWDWKVR
jgi:hypothetical protein